MLITAPPAPPVRHITVRAYRARFTPTERARIELAMLDDPAGTDEQRDAAAGLRAQMRDLESAGYVDLDDMALTRTPTAHLEAAGYLDAPGRAVNILDAAVQTSERP